MAEVLRIDLAAEFTGKKAFDKADKSVSALDKTAKKLAKTFASVFAAQKILAFGRASVQAFAQDQAAATRLAKVVDNLGLSFANPAISDFIQKLEQQSGIVDDQLRPAFQALLTTTGDVAKSQQLLANAIDISRGSGEDLNTVVDDLSKGYVGITKGLEKYKLGLSRAQLKATSFSDVMVLLNKQFNGSSSAYLETYAGKLSILNVAADNAKETIGKGLIDAFTTLSGESSNIQSIADAMNNAAEATANFSRGIARIVADLKNIPGLDAVLKFLEFSIKYSPANLIANLGKVKPSGYGDYAGSTVDYQRQQDEKAAAKAKAVADAKAAALAKSTLKSQQALTAEQKKQAQLKKDGTVFDQQQIELIAALKGQLSDDDRRRAELQLALLNGNVSEADKLTKQILMATDSTGKLYQYFLQTPDAKNPFGYLDQWIKDFQQKLNNLQFPTATAYVPAGLAPELAAIGVVAGYGDYAGSVTNQASSTLGNGSFGMQSGGLGAVPNFIPGTSIYGSANGATQGPIALTISGDGALTNAIADALQNKSLSTGNAAYINRRTGGFE
jgi:hypothetical protein